MTVKKWIAMITLSMLFSGTLIWEAYAGTWKQGIDGDLSAWWYDNGDGTFPISTWMWIDGNDDGIAECYYFDDTGRMLSDTVTPDGYTVDKNGAWKLGFVRHMYSLNSYQEEIFKDAAECLLNLYEDQFYVPSFTYGQLRYLMYEDRQKLMNSLLAADTEKHLNNPDITTMFVPLRIEDGIGYFDRDKTLDDFYAVFNIGLNPENIPQSEQGELKGIPFEKENKYKITDCEQSSDGTFLYMKLKYAKTDVVTNKILRTGTFYMKLYRNKSDDIGYYIDIISNQESFG